MENIDYFRGDVLFVAFRDYHLLGWYYSYEVFFYQPNCRKAMNIIEIASSV